MMHKKRFGFKIHGLSAALLGLGVFSAQAALISGPDILSVAPADLSNNPPGATNTHQQGFDELQGVLLGSALAVDGGSIAAGMVVSSHMIFLNTVGNVFAAGEETWTFDGDILGVMSGQNGGQLAASNGILGLPGVIYSAAFNNQGLEGGDHYSVSGNTLALRMQVTEPGDWIRVVTATPAVPEPSTLGLFGLGCLGMAAFGLRRRRP